MRRIAALVLAIGCGADAPSGGDATAVGTVGTDGSSTTGSASTSGADDTGEVGTGGSVDGGADSSTGETPMDCAALVSSGWTVDDALELAWREFVVDVAPESVAPGPIFATAGADDTIVVGWAAPSRIHLTALAADDATLVSDVVVDGREIHGLVSDASGHALLVHRDPDVLALAKLDKDGTVLFDQVELGGVDQNVTGSEWWQTTWFMGEGRLARTGDGYVGYFQVRRLWDDGVAHVGDTLRLWTDDGTPMMGGWDWGCSHSMDQRLAVDGMRVGPLCISDCYPGQGVYFDHTIAVTAEPGGDCAGQIAGELGGLVPAPDGFWAALASASGGDGRDVALVHIADDATVGAPIWLTDTPGADESAVHLARFAGGLLVGWRDAAGVSLLARADQSGALVAGPALVASTWHDHDDFFAWPEADVGWTRSTEPVKLVLSRAHACVAD